MSIYDLQLRKGGELVSLEWENKKDAFIEKKISAEDFLFYINNTICLDKNFTLRDLFVFIKRDVDYFSLVTSCPVLIDLVADCLSENTLEEQIEEIAFLELKKVSFLEEDVFNGKKYLERHIEFSGVNNEMKYGIEYVPLNVLSKFPIFIDESVDVVDVNKEVDQNVVFNYNEKFTLFELLNGVIEELAFIVDGDQKALIMERIKEAVNQDERGETTFLNIEELRERLKISSEKGKVSCRLCGEDSRSQHFNKPKDICFKCFKSSKEN